MMCLTCEATYTSGYFCPTCNTRLVVVAVDQPAPPVAAPRAVAADDVEAPAAPASDVSAERVAPWFAHGRDAFAALTATALREPAGRSRAFEEAVADTIAGDSDDQPALPSVAEIRAAYQREQAEQQAALATANDDAVPTPAPREDDPMLDANSDDDESAPALPAPPSPTRMSDEDEAGGELEWSPDQYMPELADLPVAEAKKLYPGDFDQRCRGCYPIIGGLVGHYQENQEGHICQEVRA